MLDDIPGVTARQRAALHAAGIDTVRKLRARLRAGDDVSLGPAARAYLEHRPKKKVRLEEAEWLAQELGRSLWVRGRGAVARSRVVLVGSGRRGRAVLKDVDILVVVPDSWRDVLARLEVRGGGVELLASYAAGARRRSVILRSASRGGAPRGGASRGGAPRGSTYRVDLFLATDSEKPYALLHHTGSWKYNVRVRAHAKSRGWKLNQYGVFVRGSEPPRRVPGSARVKTEADLARLLGVTPRPPHLREL